MREACDRTTGQRARMFLCGDESERCNASDQPDRLRNSSQHMLRFTTLSMSVAISSRLQRNVGSVPKPSRHGAPPWALQPETAFICNRLDRTRQRDKPLKMPSGYIRANPWLTIATRQMEMMRRFAVELGMTPSSRSRVEIVRRAPSKFDGLIGRPADAHLNFRRPSDRF